MDKGNAWEGVCVCHCSSGCNKSEPMEVMEGKIEAAKKLCGDPGCAVKEEICDEYFKYCESRPTCYACDYDRDNCFLSWLMDRYYVTKKR